LWKPGAKEKPLALPVMQCAAVIKTSPAGLATTLAVQKCFLLVALSKRAPTVGVPGKALDFCVPVGGLAAATPVITGTASVGEAA
jgi:hypothetical protein